jgi:hypothetical protein
MEMEIKQQDKQYSWAKNPLFVTQNPVQANSKQSWAFWHIKTQV